MNSISQTAPLRSGSNDEACPACRVSIEGRKAFWVRGKLGRLLKCTRCSLLDLDLAKRSASVSLVVGTILVAINHADKITGGSFDWHSNWSKILLSYVVPFCVATYGALSNSERK